MKNCREVYGRIHDGSANARTSLRQALWRVNQALDFDRNYLLVDDFSITFNAAAPYWLDVAVLDQKGVDAGPLEELIAAVSVLRGSFCRVSTRIGFL